MGTANSIVHKNLLRPSTQDEIALCYAVQERFITLLDSYLQIRGVALVPPDDLANALLRWREMAIRFKKADFRSSDEEIASLKEIAQWTLDENCSLRGQPSVKLDCLR